MKGILDSLLDVNRIESGSLVPSTSDFQLNDVFDSVADDFRDLAKEKGLKCRVVRSTVTVHSDRHMLEVMPDLVLSDFNLPGPMNGVESISALRVAFASEIPAVVLTGDVRLQGLETITNQNIEIAMKPVDGDQLIQLINQLMPVAKSEDGRLVKSLLEH
jgi:DNA-binding NarL/FixJ family response regulator